jgi:uncharacterized protein
MRFLIVGAVLGLATAWPAARADDSASKEQIWEGTLSVRPGVDLRLIVRVTNQGAGEPAAVMDSPDEGLKGFKLTSVTVDKSRLAFDLKVSGARYDGKLNAAGTQATGQWSQRGANLPLTFTKKDKPTPEPKLVGKEQFWQGKLPIGNGIHYRFLLRLATTETGEILGKLDSLDEGFKGLKLSAITLDKARLAFELKMSAAKYEGKLNKEGTESVGTWSQRGVKIPLTFTKTEKPMAVLRPQTPKPPYPYKVEDVTYRNERANVILAGTVTSPAGKGPFPAVILISGSGAQDRDETILQHKPFLVLADHLTRRGIAVLRVDDRGVGRSTGNVATSTSEDFASDVLAGIAFLKSRDDVDPKRIGLIGHSEGGLIAPMVASRSTDVAFISMLAGTGLPGEQIMYLQGRLIGKALGADEKELVKQREIQQRLFDIIKSETDTEKAHNRLLESTKKMLGDLPEDERKQAKDMEALLDSQVKGLDSPWFRFFLTFDPRPTLAKVRCPVLALNGEKDLQVPAKENLQEIRHALERGGNTQATVKALPSLNHLFQTCKTGAVSEYGEIEETFAPVALQSISDWIIEQVRSRP